MKSRDLNLTMFAQAVPLLVRNPALLLAPLFMEVVTILIQLLLSTSSPQGFAGGLGSGLVSLFIFIVESFGLGVSLIIADGVWRRGRASFDDGWTEGRRKAGDIIIAGIGVNFVTYIAQQVGALVGGPLGFGLLGIVLFVLAFYFLIYAIPAAAIGGIPGGGSLAVSIDRVRSNYLQPAALALVFVLLYGVATVLPLQWLGQYGMVAFLVAALLKAIVFGYFALVLARSYTDAAFTRRW